MRTYTEKIHIKRLVKVLKMENIDTHCPAGYRYGTNIDKLCWKNYPCEICKKFVMMDTTILNCPCFHFGEERARELSWKALEKKGVYEN